MQILIWGDVMKRNIGICIFVLFVIAVGVTVLMNNINADSNEINTKDNIINTQSVDTEAMIKTNAQVEVEGYYIGISDNTIVVYENDGQTVYLETNIAVAHLSENTIERLNKRILCKNLNEVYDLLESYSS